MNLRAVKPLLGEMPEGPLKVKIGGTYELVDIAGGQETGAYLDVEPVSGIPRPD